MTQTNILIVVGIVVVYLVIFRTDLIKDLLSEVFGVLMLICVVGGVYWVVTTYNVIGFVQGIF